MNMHTNQNAKIIRLYLDLPSVKKNLLFSREKNTQEHLPRRYRFDISVRSMLRLISG